MNRKDQQQNAGVSERTQSPDPPPGRVVEARTYGVHDDKILNGLPPPPYTADSETLISSDLNLYRVDAAWNTTLCQLGPDETQPLLTVLFGNSWRSIIRLYRKADYDDGRDHHAEVVSLAIVTPPDAISSQASIELPSKSRTYQIGHSYSAYSFIIPVPQRGYAALWPEKFEWRRSRGKEVREDEDLGEEWKLIRLRRSLTSCNEDQSRGDGTSRDGKEVVAIWAELTEMSDIKIGRLQFSGSGASGELGKNWTMLAAASALHIYQRERGET